VRHGDQAAEHGTADDRLHLDVRRRQRRVRRTHEPLHVLCPGGGRRLSCVAQVRLQRRREERPPDQDDQQRPRPLFWKWGRGAIDVADLGDPTTDTDYHLCMYTDGALATEMPFDAGASWSARGERGYRFYTEPGTGKVRLTVRARDGRSRIELAARGDGLAIPTLPIAYSSDVTVQLVNSASDACWQSTFAAPARRNIATRFFDTD
jgi:hypothetical protein